MDRMEPAYNRASVYDTLILLILRCISASLIPQCISTLLILIWIRCISVLHWFPSVSLQHLLYSTVYPCSADSAVYLSSTEEIRRVASHTWSVKCVFVLNVPCKGSWCTVDLCPAWPMWNHVEQKPDPLHRGHSSPSNQATTQYTFILLAALKRDGPWWCTSRGFRAAQSMILGIVYICIVFLFFSQQYCLFEYSSNVLSV